MSQDGVAAASRMAARYTVKSSWYQYVPTWTRSAGPMRRAAVGGTRVRRTTRTVSAIAHRRSAQRAVMGDEKTRVSAAELPRVWDSASEAARQGLVAVRPA